MSSDLSAFDPAHQGTPERVWRAALDPLPAWAPTTARLLVVSPHPDDEVLGAGGLIRGWAQAGRAVTVVSITDGEAAYPDWRGLDQIRHAELTRAIDTLCTHGVISVRLRIPDGRVARHTATLRAALSALADQDTTLIAPYESDGHPDHEAAGAVCCELARTKDLALARYPIWAWHRLTPATMPVRWAKFPLQRAACQAKAAAARCFVSQVSPPDRPPIVPAHVMTYFTRPYEAFVI